MEEEKIVERPHHTGTRLIAVVALLWLSLFVMACRAQPVVHTNLQPPTPADDPARVPPSSEPSGLFSYFETFTGEGRKGNSRFNGPYAKDRHVWVYTSAFAKRFGMPEEWVDDKLYGAEAIAYRVDWGYYDPMCGYFGELENCRPTPACVIDLYIPDSANLPWNTDIQYDSKYGYKSKGFLRPQSTANFFGRSFLFFIKISSRAPVRF